MEIYHFVNGHAPIRHETIEAMPGEGLVWIDFLRSECEGWERYPRQLLGIDVEFQHQNDARNANHPSFFHGTEAYDLLIFEALGASEQGEPLQTRTACFFMFERLLITVRAAGNISFDTAKRRFTAPRVRIPTTMVSLAHFFLDLMVDRYLAIRETMDREVTRMQDELLDPSSSMNNWRALLNARREARRLESLSEAQLDALDSWRRSSSLEWSEPDCVHIRDLVEHVTRVRSHASDLERDLEAAVQLHFAATSFRTNEIMKIFTVMSVVFMPLTLLTGIWGMNFKYMPELEWVWGYPLALLSIVLLGAAMLLWFRRRRFF